MASKFIDFSQHEYMGENFLLSSERPSADADQVFGEVNFYVRGRVQCMYVVRRAGSV